MRKYLYLTGLSALIFNSTVCFAAEPKAADAGDISALVSKGTSYADLRYRYEHVDQDPFAKNAVASTLRTKLGFLTGTWQNLQGQLEFEFVSRLGNDTYNNGINGHTAYPNVTDPYGNELNQAWVSWAGLPKTAVKAGRQIVNLDNQRFIGSVGWRQNDQTLDSAVITNNSIKDLSLLYGYAWNVNRIFGDKNSAGDLDMQAHLLHGDYVFVPGMKLTAYAYLLDIEELPNFSSKTFGLRMAGDHKISEDLSFSYTFESANQSDYKNSPLSYSESYYHVVPGISWKNWTFQSGYEVLGGNGTANESFQTPLATLHAFNGWADKFLTTPANGLTDGYGRIAYKIEKVNTWIDGTVLEGIYHDFDAKRTNQGYGSEWDMQASKTFKTPSTIMAPHMKEWSVSLKRADFSADAGSGLRDTTKYWITIGTKF